MKRITTLIVLITGLSFAANAEAHRPATRAEQMAMIYHAGSHYAGLTAKQVDEPRAFPLQCSEADIATVAKGWGAWAPVVTSHVCDRWGANAWIIEHKIGRRWLVVAEGDLLPAHIPGVPHRIAVDVIRGLPTPANPLSLGAAANAAATYALGHWPLPPNPTSAVAATQWDAWRTTTSCLSADYYEGECTVDLYGNDDGSTYCQGTLDVHQSWSLPATVYVVDENDESCGVDS